MSTKWMSVLLLGALTAGGYALAGPDEPMEPASGPHEFRPRGEFGPQGRGEFGPQDRGEFGPPGHRMERMEERSDRILDREQEILEELRKTSPEKVERLMWLKQEHPELYPMALGKIARTLEMAKKDPATAERMDRMEELRHSLRGKAEGFDSLPLKEQKARRTEMEGMARELFDLRQAELQARVDHAAEKLEETRGKLKKREADREKIISQHLDRLILGPGEEL
jgi:hypothetical protein